MSRFEWDDYGDRPEYNNAAELFERRAISAIYSKNGRAQLRELKEALEHLPRKELIEGALCRRKTVGDETLPDEVLISKGQLTIDGAEVQQPFLATVSETSMETEIVEGVCAVGAFLWWKKVKAGMDPVKAFMDLPTLDTGPDGEDAEGTEMFDTAWAGERGGLTYTLAWELASGNDETFARATPTERYQKFMEWIDKVLASPPLRRKETVRRDRLGRSYSA